MFYWVSKLLSYNQQFMAQIARAGIQDICNPKVGVGKLAIGQRTKRSAFNSWQDQEILILAKKTQMDLMTPPASY
jgi:hypothetical protein